MAHPTRVRAPALPAQSESWGRSRRGPSRPPPNTALRAHSRDELLGWRPTPLRDQRFLGRQEVAPVLRVEAVGVGPVLVDAAPRIGPVVVNLAAQEVPPDSPHVLVLAELEIGRASCRERV